MFMATKLRRMIAYLGIFLPKSQMVLWDHVTKPLYLYYHGAYGHQTWQGGDLPWGAPA